MEEKSNFDDIILDKNEKGEKVKKLLLRIIALVILFLVVLIVMKLLSGNEAQTPIPVEPGNTDTDFENIPINSQNGGELDEFEILKLRMQGLDEDNASESNQTFTMPLPSSEYNATPPVPSEPVSKPQPADKPADKPATKPADKPKDTTKTETKKPTTQQKPATQGKAADDLSAGTYIQIFSVSNFDPKSKELALIKQSGYEYKLYKTKVGGKDITRVLVGPFSKDEVGAELKKVQENIRKDAFTYQIK